MSQVQTTWHAHFLLQRVKWLFRRREWVRLSRKLADKEKWRPQTTGWLKQKQPESAEAAAWKGERGREGDLSLTFSRRGWQVLCIARRVTPKSHLLAAPRLLYAGLWANSVSPPHREVMDPVRAHWRQNELSLRGGNGKWNRHTSQHEGFHVGIVARCRTVATEGRSCFRGAWRLCSQASKKFPHRCPFLARVQFSL